MPSTFTWLDYSEHERKTMLDVVELFGEKSTVDEIGIGQVRDAFADLWFPGTSTIQTAAKYFLLVPWTYLSLEQRHVGAERFADEARKIETKTIQHLIDSGAQNGIIGRVARDSLQRLPSTVYWQGLRTWGIRQFEGSQDFYHRSVDDYYSQGADFRHLKSVFHGETTESEPQNWNSGIPTMPKGFPEGASLDLTKEEATFLRHRVQESCKNSLLEFLLTENVAIDGETFVWDLPIELPPKLLEQVEHGRRFSEAMHGAQLLYNIILADLKKWDEQISLFRDEWERWTETINARLDNFQTWDLKRFWEIVGTGNRNISPRASDFIGKWIRLVQEAKNVGELRNSEIARDLIRTRERQIKKGLARVGGGRPLELWKGESGAAQLDLRWRSARRIIVEILKGLGT